jgi:hypothetical protein
MSSSKCALALVAGAVVTVTAAPGLFAKTLADIEVVPQRGQSADLARRDRYECHNWALEQTGVVPARPAAGDGERDDKRERNRQTIDGALIGAGVGSFIRAAQGKGPAEGLLVGAAAGAVAGTVAANRREAKREDEPDPVFDEYVRALSACLEGRGYEVAIAGDAEG